MAEALNHEENMTAALCTLACMLSYLGPGGLLGSIGAFLALAGAVVLAFFGLLWYPLKRLFGRGRKGGEKNETAESVEDRRA